MQRYQRTYKKRSESTEQERVISWCEWNKTKIPELEMIFHIPNGGSRDKREAANLKSQGVKAGVPDLCLAVPSSGYHGLYIEMKFGKNKTTENQDKWLENLSRYGYKTAVCYTAYAAIKEIINYLGVYENYKDYLEGENKKCQV